MEELLASFKKPITVSRNEQVSGKVVSILDKEIIVDLGAKSEGVLGKKDLSPEELENLKVGSEITSYVESESDSGQIILSMVRKVKSSRGGPMGKSINWDKFTKLLNNKSRIKVTVIEANKGGLVVEYEGERGFIPSSQIDPKMASADLQSGRFLQVFVLEVDSNNNRLVFSQKDQIDENQFLKMAQNFPVDEIVKGLVVGVSDAGVIVTLDQGIGGFISSNKLEGNSYTVGQSASFIVEGVDKNRKRINLSPMLTTTKGLIYK